MKQQAKALFLSACLGAGAQMTFTAQTPVDVAKSLTVAISLPNAQTNGVAIAGKRTFLVIAKQKGQDVPQLAEYIGGTLHPYPDASWNNWKEGLDASRMFVHAKAEQQPQLSPADGQRLSPY